MTIQDCYAEMGGDFQAAIKRLVKDTLVQKFALKFLNDKSYEHLLASLDSGDVDASFMAAHTLKGVCKNLGFAKLDGSISEMTELLRAGKLAEAKEMLPTVTADYELIIATLKKLG